MSDNEPPSTAAAATPAYLPHTLWHPMYRALRDIVESVHKLYATTVLSTAKAAFAAKSAEEAAKYQSLGFAALSWSPSSPIIHPAINSRFVSAATLD